MDNTLIVLGREFPFIYLFGCVGGVFSGGLFLTQPSQRCLDHTTMLTMLRGQFPIYILIFVDFYGLGSGVESFEE